MDLADEIKHLAAEIQNAKMQLKALREQLSIVALRQTGGSVSKAARMVGKSRAAMYVDIDAHAIDLNEIRGIAPVGDVNK